MYNRYIPQSDGSYKRRPCADTSGHRTPPPPPPYQPSPPCPPDPPSKSPSRTRSNPRETIHAGNFLRNLLPGDFDTGDLMILLLLLLMAGDCPEERSSAWLTLALYLFL